MMQQFCFGTSSKWETEAMPTVTQLNKAFIRPIHMGPMLNDILLRTAGIKNLMLVKISEPKMS